MVKINLGSGFRYLEGYINIDKTNKFFKIDLELDLELGKLPFDDNSVEIIEATHILEHINNLIPLMNECYRILEKKGIMHIQVPQGIGMVADPTHVRLFSPLSFRYYCGYPYSEAYGITCQFKVIKMIFENNEDGGVLDVILEK